MRPLSDAIGVFLDSKLGTFPYLTVIFLIVGIAAGGLNTGSPSSSRKDKGRRNSEGSCQAKGCSAESSWFPQLCCITLAALYWFSWKTASGVLLGGGIVIISFRVSSGGSSGVPSKDLEKLQPSGAVCSYYLRFLATLFLVFLVLYLGLATPFRFWSAFPLWFLASSWLGHLNLL